jgi:hypothetical protein
MTGKTRLIESEIMTRQQFINAEEDLIDRLVTMRESDCGVRTLIPEANESSGDGLDDVYEIEASSEK